MGNYLIWFATNKVVTLANALKKKHVLVLPCKIMRHAKKASQLQGAQLLQAVFTGGYLVVLSSITHPG